MGDALGGRGAVIKEEAQNPVYSSSALPPMRRHVPQPVRYRLAPDVRVASYLKYNETERSLHNDNKNLDKSMGLRHFSTKVCEKVKEKGRTNYNQVADELVAEYFAANNMNSEEFLERQKFDQKNIRRRVYDALNVLLAMNIIRKRKKDIDWVGLPVTRAGEIKRLQEEKAALNERIKRKKETIQELVVQLVSYKSLVWKNREMERLSSRPPEDRILYLPFVIINTSKNTTVDCAVSGDRSEFLFNFDQSFEVHDDFEALKRLGYSYGLEHNTINPEMMDHIDEFIPPALRGYIHKILNGEMSDWETRVRPSTSAQSVQYLIREAPDFADKTQPAQSVIEQSGSDHSSDGSYAEIAPTPVYTIPENLHYTPAPYATEVGDGFELVDASAEYPGYPLASAAEGYETVDDSSRPEAMGHVPSKSRRIAHVVSLSDYGDIGPSTSKAHTNVARVIPKRSIYTAVPTNQVFRKTQDGNVVYSISPKRQKTDSPMFNM